MGIKKLTEIVVLAFKHSKLKLVEFDSKLVETSIKLF